MKNKNILFAIAVVFAITAVAGFALASPSVVTGTVYLADGVTPVGAGANVDVTCEHLGVNATGSDVTIADGTYFVVFDDTECGYDDWAWVSAEFGGQTGTGSGQVCTSEDCPIPVALIDVTLPEFTVVGAMIVVLTGLGLVVYRRNK